MEANYIAKKSKVRVLNVWLILFFWLVIPLIIQIARILSAHCYSIEFYNDKMIIKSGVLNKNESQVMFAGVYAVSIKQSIIGRMFNYGDLSIDAPGKWADINTEGIKDPVKLKNYLQSKITTAGVTNVIAN